MCNARNILALSESKTNHSCGQTYIMFFEAYTSVLDTDNKINGKEIQYRQCFGQEAVCAITLRRKVTQGILQGLRSISV